MFFYILRRITLLVITLLVLTMGAYLLEFRLIGQVLDFWHGYPDFLQRIVEGDFGLSSVSGLPVLDEIRRENFQVLHQRISLPPTRKLWLAAKTWIKG